jgi:hypothetical protein
MKNSHFERTVIRHRGLFSTLVLKEAENGESTQDGTGARDSGVTSARLVAAADCP